MTSTRLTESQRRQYERDGYLAPIRVLDEPERNRFRAAYLDYTERHRERLQKMTGNQKYQVFSETHFALPWVHELVTHPRILDTIESILGPNILAWNTNWFSKMPGDKAYVSWHQDGTYWKLTPPTVVTAWVALWPSLPVNGCMRVVPGTHTQPALPQRETYEKDNMLSRGQEIAVEVKEEDAVDLALQPGEMSLHHIWIVHGSKANTSKDTPRIGIAIRYTKPEVKQESPFKPCAMLVRGQDRIGNFDLLPPPTSQDFAEQTKLQATVIDRIRAGIMTDAKRAA